MLVETTGNELRDSVLESNTVRSERVAQPGRHISGKTRFWKCAHVGVCGLALLAASNQPPCRAEGADGNGKIQLLSTSANPRSTLVDNTLSEGAGLSGLVLTFVDSVWLNIVEGQTSDASGARTLGLIAIESLSERDSEWYVELGERIPPDAWLGVAEEAGNITLFAVGSGQVWDIASLTVEGESAFTGAWAAYVDAEGFIRTFPRTGGFSNFPIRLVTPWENSPDAIVNAGRGTHALKLTRAAKPQDQDDQGDVASDIGGLSYDGDTDSTAAVSCCSYGGACIPYGGGCPAGSESVSCPCPISRLSWSGR